MTSDFQRQSRRRKIFYALAILLLFSLSLVYRPYVLEAKADSLALREQNQGEVDPLGATIRLSLIGSRGVALCVLWNMAIETQMRHEWNKLDVLIKSITQLQPHFITPWLFQSWNLAYNVSAESDRIRDKYFYISRGIELLAEGERQNRNHPDLRFSIGYYYLDKIGMADQQRTLRTLFQLSCIDPQDRDPARMRQPDGRVDLEKFKLFCETHPHVARRLREMQNLRTPDDVLDFLAEHYEIPSRYEKPIPGMVPGPSRLKPADKQFPILPRPEDIRRDQAMYGHGYRYDFTADDAFPSDFDNYSAAMIWFTFAQEPLPDPLGKPGPLPMQFDRLRYRLPRAPATMIFRGYPMMAQTRFAEQLQREGWFDRGWEVDQGKFGPDRWFAEQVVIGNFNWSTVTWAKADAMWQDHGKRNGLYFDTRSLAALQEQARLYRETYGIGPFELDSRLRPDDFEGEMRHSFEAHYQLVWYRSNRELTNFTHFFAQAQAEKDPDAIAARALFFEAIRRRKTAAPADAIRRLYEQGFAKWFAVLDRYPDFRQDLLVQELNYRLQFRYLDVVLEKQDSQLRAVLAVQDTLEAKRTSLKQVQLVPELLSHFGSRAAVPVLWLPPVHLLMPGNLAERPKGPFDRLAADGKPYITPEAVRRGKTRLDLDDLH